jgi:hypothetical protein
MIIHTTTICGVLPTCSFEQSVFAQLPNFGTVLDEQSSIILVSKCLRVINGFFFIGFTMNNLDIQQQSRLSHKISPYAKNLNINRGMLYHARDSIS